MCLPWICHVLVAYTVLHVLSYKTLFSIIYISSLYKRITLTFWIPYYYLTFSSVFFIFLSVIFISMIKDCYREHMCLHTWWRPKPYWKDFVLSALQTFFWPRITSLGEVTWLSLTVTLNNFWLWITYDPPNLVWEALLCSV
jgi:hypothetical protein